ncbi:hypothetical protein KIN20_022471 [Parelaphostrongylus tenuis]|uniref:Uncharacterized protein n=1 Tax=Parelaphostrongylus tenuis TaxID=148309 RepID=A0AAD5MVK1_PARTN|nr:hypothetical protein KIN20_022471 [Parelaphostrongylus tenuis]
MTDPTDPPRRCIIAGGTVTGNCIGGAVGGKCSETDDPTKATIAPVTNYTSISGTLSDVLNRAVRMLALGPFGPNFFSADGSVGRS